MQNKFELLKYYQDQWKYRNTHYWKLVNRHLTFGIMVILLPSLCDYLGIVRSDTLSPWVFSVAGIVVSAMFVYLLLCETDRARCMSGVLYKLINEIGEGEYNPGEVRGIFKVKLAYVIPFAIFLFHVLLAVFY